jgi:integrase/recombinase XerD
MRYIFSYYNQKDPTEITQEDIIRYLNFIKKQFRSGYDKCRMVAQACSFFYKNILRVPYVVPSSFYPRRGFKLPNILTQAQVKHLLKSTTNPNTAACYRCFMAQVLGLEEMCHLKMSCINSKSSSFQQSDNQDEVELAFENFRLTLQMYQ